MKYLGAPQSGSQANTTASRNRFGQYYRNRSIPVNPASGPQLVQRARLAANATAWKSLTSAQRAGWNDFATQINLTDALGQAYTPTGFNAYVLVNNNNTDAGNAVVANAPAYTTPNALTLGTVTITAAAFTVAYTVTPLPAGNRCFLYVSLQRSAGRTFEADLRLLQVSAAAAASPVDAYAAYLARFGLPIVGNRIFVRVRCFATGLLSADAGGSAVVA